MLTAGRAAHAAAAGDGAVAAQGHQGGHVDREHHRQGLRLKRRGGRTARKRRQLRVRGTIRAGPVHLSVRPAALPRHTSPPLAPRPSPSPLQPPYLFGDAFLTLSLSWHLGLSHPTPTPTGLIDEHSDIAPPFSSSKMGPHERVIGSFSCFPPLPLFCFPVHATDVTSVSAFVSSGG